MDVYKKLKISQDREKLITECAMYYIEHKSTVRGVAKEFCVSKSIIHRWFIKDLKYLDYDLYLQVKKQLSINKKLAPYHGGQASSRKLFLNKGVK